MRRRWLLIAVAGILPMLCLAASQQASGNTTRDGWGLFVADDDWDFTNPSYTMPSLEDHFAKLGPKVFRLQIVWNAMEPAPAQATADQLAKANQRAIWVTRTHAMIDRAKLRGASQIILTLRANHVGGTAADDGTGGFVPSAVRYETEIKKVVDEFASKVDVWGGINEPNLWQTSATTVGAIPASTLVDYQDSLAEVVGLWDPTAQWTSPDFTDHEDSPNWDTYVQSYENAGGSWGHYAAFHPYKAITNQSLSTVTTFAGIVPSNKDIWVTEAGAEYLGDPVGQNNRAWWMAHVLAAQTRVKRIAYYNMRGGGTNWDTGLLDANFVRRPAWYTWCAAAHNDNLGHADCKPDQAVTGDWDGDGTSTVGVYRPSSGAWYLRNSNSYGDSHTMQYGFAGALPVVGDWDGNGTDTIGLYYPATGMWYLRNTNSSGAADITFQYGFSGTTPVAGDWNNDGTDTIGLYAPSAAPTWYLRNANSSGAADHVFQYGFSGAAPVTGDWNNDGTDTIGVYDPVSFNWHLRNTNSYGAANVVFTYGFGGTAAVAGDWNNDGTDTIGLYDPRPTMWYLRNSNSTGAASAVFNYGAPG